MPRQHEARVAHTAERRQVYPRGGEVRICAFADAEDCVCIDITDTGIGMDELGAGTTVRIILPAARNLSEPPR